MPPRPRRRRWRSWRRSDRCSRSCSASAFPLSGAHPASVLRRIAFAIKKLPEGEPVAIDSWIPDTGFQIPDAIVWQPPPVQAGESYRITITRPSKATVTYDVELVDCNALDP